MAVELAPDRREYLIGSIKRFFAEELDEDIGELKAGLVLDFALAEIGPSVYNQAVADAQRFVEDRVGDLGASCFEPEGGYWRK